MPLEGIVEHAGTIQRENLVKRARWCIDRQARRGTACQRPGAEQRVKIRAMIWVPMADQYRAYGGRIAKLQ